MEDGGGKDMEDGKEKSKEDGEAKEKEDGGGGLKEDGGARRRSGAPIGRKFRKEDADQSRGAAGEGWGGEDDTCTVSACIRGFIEVELLLGENMYNCEACSKAFAEAGRVKEEALRAARVLKGGSSSDGSGSGEDTAAKIPPKVKATVMSPATKQCLFWELPPVQVISLKRFVHTVRGTTVKINCKVSFPEQLDLSPFCHRDSPASRETYRLFGVVSHSGSLSSGHYVAYSRDLRDPAGAEKPGWHYFSDTTVKSVTEAKVLESEAYVLFYCAVGRASL
ncbi:hypothetical protein T484DRAFT_3492189 [Baffinella frigidus]|nr:hypothetical protein T484DRAFT_3492189 [Cryptophyta sp. CCMP2293]